MNTNESARVEAILQARYGVPISVEEHAAFQRAVMGAFTGSVTTSQSKDGRYLNENAGKTFHVWLLAVEWALQQCAKGRDPRSAALATSPAPAGPVQAWKPLSDVQWMNIVNHDRAWHGHTKDEAVHEAVKMTEAKLKEINTATSPAPSVKQEASDSVASEKEALRRLAVQSMADCMDMVRNDLVEMGIIDEKVAPMFIPESIAAYVKRCAAPSASQGEVKVPEGWRELLGEAATMFESAARWSYARRLWEAEANEMAMAKKIRNALAAAPSVTDGGVSGFYIEDNCGDTEI